MTPATLPEDLFTAALVNPTEKVPPGLSDGNARPAGKRFDVYRNNVAVSLGDAILTGFPIITKLLGETNMKGLAAMFLRAHPPTSPLMMHYGRAFPEFLANISQLSHLGYLADVARLELALRRAYHAADASAMAATRLGELTPEQLVEARVGIARAAQVLRSDWPLYDIWRFNTRENAPQPGAEAQDILITRPEFDPVPDPLPPGGADWIEALQNGQTIGTALEHANSRHPGFDLGAPLALLLQGNALTSLTLKEATP